MNPRAERGGGASAGRRPEGSADAPILAEERRLRQQCMVVACVAPSPESCAESCAPGEAPRAVCRDQRCELER